MDKFNDTGGTVAFMNQNHFTFMFFQFLQKNRKASNQEQLTGQLD